MNPQKLTEFSEKTMVLKEAEKYLHQIIDKEILCGLKKYMEVELFPHIQLKVGKGVSVSTAQRWLQCKGFQYMEHKRALYYDGHDRPDVITYHQNVFLPAMEAY